MGFLSKAWKGVKNTFKKIGKGIKSALMSVGKFMDKIGIVGQIGLSLLLPGIGGMLAKGFNAVIGSMTAYQGIGSTVINAAGGFLQSAGEIAGSVGKAFGSITDAVKNTVGETLKFGAKKLGLGQVATGIGKTFGSQRFLDLGQSISKASFDNITRAVTKGFENIGVSFENIGTSFSDVFNPDADPMKGLTDVQDTGAVTKTTTPSPEALREQASAQIQQLKDSGMSLDAIKQEVPSEYLDLVDPMPKDSLLTAPAQRGVTVGVDTPDLYGPNASQRIMEQDAFIAAQEKALADLPAVGDKNFVMETTREVQEGLARKLREQAANLREGYTAFKEDPLGVTAGFAAEKAVEGVESGIKTSALYKTAEEFDVDMTPDVHQTYHSTFVAPVDYVQVTPAEAMSPTFFAKNESLFSTHPYGVTAFVADNNYYQNLSAGYNRGVNV